MIAGGWSVLLGFGFLFAPVPTPPPTTPPKAPPPQMLWISEFDTSKGVVKTLSAVLVPVTRAVERTVNVNGVPQKQTGYVTEYATEYRETQMQFGEVEARTVDGKKLEGDRLEAGVKGKAVLLVTDDKGIDPAYLPLFAKDTIILMVKPKK
jgi:hypothetical protein